MATTEIGKWYVSTRTYASPEHGRDVYQVVWGETLSIPAMYEFAELRFDDEARAERAYDGLVNLIRGGKVDPHDTGAVRSAFGPKT